MTNIIKAFRASGAIGHRRLVKFTANEDEVALATASTDIIAGVSDCPGGAVNKGRIDVVLKGPAQVEAGGPLTPGGAFTADANGRAVAAAPIAGVKTYIGGRSLNNAVAGDIIEALVNPRLGLSAGAGTAIDPLGFYFASGRFRNPQNAAAIAAGNEYRVDRGEMWSPAYVTREYGFQLPASYMQGDGTEVDLPNSFNVEAVYIHAFIGGAWVSHLVPASAVTVNPGVGVFIQGTYPQDIPPNTRLLFSIASNVPAGGSMLAAMAPSQATGRLEGARWGSSSQLAQAAGTAALTGTDGRIAGAIYTPSYVVFKPKVALDRPVFWVHGDSIAWGKNEMEQYLASAYLAHGFVGRALDDDTRSRRMPYCNTAIPGTSATLQVTRNSWSRTLDRFRQCPNRPYTHIITEHYNNGAFTDAGYRDRAKAYYGVLRAESVFWGNAPAPVYQTRCIPRVGGTNYATSLAGQAMAPALTETKWQFDADVRDGYFTELAGSIDVNRDFAYDQDANRNKVKLDPFLTTTTASFASGGTSIQLNDAVAVGDFLVVDPDGPNPRGSHVRSVSGSQGAYIALLGAALTASFASGVTVKKSYMGDGIALHPSTPGHILIAGAIIDWKSATFPAGV